MDLPTIFSKTRDSILNLLSRESAHRAVRSQTTTWIIRFIKDQVEHVDLAFYSRMTPVYNLNDIGEIVGSMIKHMSQQVENPALRDSKFVFHRVMQMEISMDSDCAEKFCEHIISEAKRLYTLFQNNQ